MKPQPTDVVFDVWIDPSGLENIAKGRYNSVFPFHFTLVVSGRESPHKGLCVYSGLRLPLPTKEAAVAPALAGLEAEAVELQRNHMESMQHLRTRINNLLALEGPGETT